MSKLLIRVHTLAFRTWNWSMFCPPQDVQSSLKVIKKDHNKLTFDVREAANTIDRLRVSAWLILIILNRCEVMFTCFVLIIGAVITLYSIEDLLTYNLKAVVRRINDMLKWALCHSIPGSKLPVYCFTRAYMRNMTVKIMTHASLSCFSQNQVNVSGKMPLNLLVSDFQAFPCFILNLCALVMLTSPGSEFQ